MKDNGRRQGSLIPVDSIDPINAPPLIPCIIEDPPLGESEEKPYKFPTDFLQIFNKF